MKISRLALALAAVGLLYSGASHAATQEVTANIAFDTALNIAKTNDINFGTVKALTSGTYVISTAGVVTPSNGGETISGTPQAGLLVISGSATQTIDVAANNYVADSGVTPSSATCAYNGGGEAACSLSGVAAPAGGKNLLLGVQVVADGTQAAGSSAAPTFDVVVTYH